MEKANAIYFDSVEAFILRKTSSYFLQNKRIFTLQTLVDLGSDLRDNVYASVRKKENWLTCQRHFFYLQKLGMLTAKMFSKSLFFVFVF